MEMVTISKELQLATHMTAQEIRRELTVQLYAQGKLSAGKARALAEMTGYEFQCLLGSRGDHGELRGRGFPRRFGHDSASAARPVKVISNSSPLINFAALGRLTLLRELYGTKVLQEAGEGEE